MLQRDGMVMVEMKVLVMEMMMVMIPMKSGAMVMMAMISPLWEGIFPTDFRLPESFSLYGVFCPVEVAVSISEPPRLRFSGMMKYVQGQDLKWARVASHYAGMARGQAAPPMCEPTPWLLSPPPSGFLSLSAKYNFLVFF
jgi:hypothetical protein